jgi:hypothetical protein
MPPKPIKPNSPNKPNSTTGNCPDGKHCGPASSNGASNGSTGGNQQKPSNRNTSQRVKS